MNVMTQSRRYQIILVGIRTGHKKLGHSIAHGRVLNVLAQCPPTIIPALFKLLVGTFE